MSGGVDSSVAAYLLLQQNQKVTAAYMKLPVYSPPMHQTNLLEEKKREFEQVRIICQKLNIPLIALEYEQEFRKEIVEYFCQEYLAGRTPNPCILCNKKLKFGLLMEKARQLGFDSLATGHYAILRKDPLSQRFYLQRAKDPQKDQSYFLYTLTQDQLKNSLFPLGNYTKEEVRNIAKKLKLPIHDKSESQEICFIPKGNYSEFIKSQIKNLENYSGPIKNRKGKILGYHKGIFSYTIGQRRGLGLYNPSPLYVLAIDLKENSIMVGEKSETYQNELIATKLNWMLLDSIPAGPKSIFAQIRYRQSPRPAVIIPKEGKENQAVKVIFKEPVKSIAPGQSIVFYLKDKVLGGGIIHEKE